MDSPSTAGAGGHYLTAGAVLIGLGALATALALAAGRVGALELELTCALGVECTARLPKSGRVVPVPATGS
jgi:hypothetical protein